MKIIFLLRSGAIAYLGGEGCNPTDSTFLEGIKFSEQCVNQYIWIPNNLSNVQYYNYNNILYFFLIGKFNHFTKYAI